MTDLWEKWQKIMLLLLRLKRIVSIWTNKQEPLRSQDRFLMAAIIIAALSTALMVAGLMRSGRCFNSQECFYICSEDSARNRELVGDTPEEALKKYLRED